MGKQRCLLCGNEDMNSLSIANYLFNKDIICDVCRSKMNLKEKIIMIEGIEVRSIYEYNEEMKNLLLQYKEGYDEALKDVFMYKYLNKFKRVYKGYTIVMIPSSNRKIKERGFNHISEIFEKSGYEIVDILQKVTDVSQKDLNYENRLKMKDNIELKEGGIIPDKVVLVDDIITTGSSVIGAYRTIEKKCKEIKVFCIAYNKSWI
jgi:ComF family protein